MQIGVVTLFPEMLDAVIDYGITSRAVDRGLLTVSSWNPRSFTADRHQTVDGRPFGGGPGMVMKIEPLRAAIQAARAELPAARVAYMSPQGRRLDQAGVAELAGRDQLILVAGRYEGIDERLLEMEVDEEWSLGDYVLSGGELAAMVVIDAVTRLLPGVLGDDLLDCPHFTRPEEYLGRRVPDVLLSGNHEAIRRWRLKQALGRTHRRRPELLEALALNKEQRKLLDEYLGESREQQLPDRP
jgi:tRNA (guanine37-N1)-methyltransferase